MTIDIRIHIDLSPRQRRVIRAAVVAGAVIGALGIGVAIAMPKHTFVSMTPISSSDMNDNFVDVDARLGALETKSPPGTILSFAGTTCPPGTVAADGAALPIVGTYFNLFQALGTTYGSPDGAHFNVPNAQGVFLRGAGTQNIGGLAYTGSQGASQNDATKANGLTVNSTSSVAGVDVFAGGNTTGLLVTGTGTPYQPLSVAIVVATNTTLGPGDAETRPANISVLYCISY